MIDRFDHLFIAPQDFDASLAFYRDVLGWKVIASWEDDDKARGAVLSGGGVKVVIAESHRGTTDEDRGPNLHLDIHNVDARFKKIPPGAHVKVAPEDTHWGTRWFVVSDPDGNLIAFEQSHSRG